MDTMRPETENNLIDKASVGDLDAFNNLIDRYKNQVFHLSLKILKIREDAEEVAQDVFLKLYKNIKKFDKKARFSTWVYRITYNECISRIRKKKRNLNIDSLENLEFQLQLVETEFEKVDIDKKKELIERSLNVLDEESKTIVLFYYYYDKSVAEIGDIVGLTESNTKIRLFRARKKLLHFFEKKLMLKKQDLL